MGFFLRRLCKDLLGLVFCISAVFKLMDPVGTSLIVEAYFKFLHLDFLTGISLGVGLAVSLVEALAAVGLLTGVYKRFFAVLTTAVLTFFTILSVVLLAANPQMDCGCFGTAVHLTHLQTFIKNVILDLLAAAAFLPLHAYDLLPGRSYFSFFFCYLLLLLFAVVSLFQIPPADFTPFASSHTIVSEEDATSDPEYPTLYLWDENAVDRSEDILHGDVAVISYYDPSGVSAGQLSRAEAFIENAYAVGMTPIILSSGEFPSSNAEVLFADYKDLITLNRSNGGVTFLSDGYIIRKRSANSMLEADDLEEISSSDPTEAYIKAATWRSLTLQAFIVVFFAVLLLL